MTAEGSTLYCGSEYAPSKTIDILVSIVAPPASCFVYAESFSAEAPGPAVAEDPRKDPEECQAAQQFHGNPAKGFLPVTTCGERAWLCEIEMHVLVARFQGPITFFPLSVADMATCQAQPPVAAPSHSDRELTVHTGRSLVSALHMSAKGSCPCLVTRARRLGNDGGPLPRCHALPRTAVRTRL